MQEKSSSRLYDTSLMNILIAIGLVLFTGFVVLDLSSDGYTFGLAMMWQVVSDGIKSGILYINPDPLPLLGYLALSLCSFVSLILSLVAYRRRRTDTKKVPIVWASFLWIVSLLLIGCFLFIIGPSCVPMTLYGSSPVCGLPVHPGVTVPTPVP